MNWNTFYKVLARTQTRGFTLLEVIIVIIVLGTVAALALPRYDVTVERMRSKEGANVLPTLLSAEKRYIIDTGVPATSLAQLDITFPQFEYFDKTSISISSAGASIKRNDNPPKNYTLSINQNGVITCSGSLLCAKMGY